MRLDSHFVFIFLKRKTTKSDERIGLSFKKKKCNHPSRVSLYGVVAVVLFSFYYLKSVTLLTM